MTYNKEQALREIRRLLALADQESETPNPDLEPGYIWGDFANAVDAVLEETDINA